MSLFPEITPFKIGYLKLTDGHTMYYEQSGNPKGKPLLVLHGGPGGAISDKHRRSADPLTTHIIAFDQRGCGKSKPLHVLKDNTTQHLVFDIERLRKHLSIDSWTVAGFSWGCVLGLAYAQSYPASVKGLVMCAVYLGTAHETEWLISSNGIGRFFPQDYAMLMEALDYPKPARVNTALISKLKNIKSVSAQTAALAWCRLEAAACNMELDRAELEADLIKDRKELPALALLEAFYFENSCFLKPNQLLNNIDKIAHIPMAIVQGGLDMVCPPESALALHAAHPNSKLYWVQLCGHRANAAGLKARVRAIKDMLKHVG